MMLRTTVLVSKRVNTRIVARYASGSSSFNSSATRQSSPNPPLDLDSSYAALLNDTHISLKKHKPYPKPAHRELEVIPGTPTAVQLSMDQWSPVDPSSELMLDFEEDEYEARERRKSPAASFGSEQISLIILPHELQAAIDGVISAGQKSFLRSDAVRLFREPDNSTERAWVAQYDTDYSSRQKAHKHAIRDGTAFATVALPVHYSAIMSVLHHIKHRVGPTWQIDKVIDWGAATGSGLWASLYSFQEDEAPHGEDGKDRVVASSILRSYIGIDKREGLVAIGKRLIEDTPKGALNVKWKKSFQDEDKLLLEERPRTIAMSAFMLNTLPNSLAQKNMVKEMWDSGAHTIILIDHNTKEGFRAIAYAREYLLDLGRAELEDPELAQTDMRGCHILAPCPHDRPCPLLQEKTSLVCGFSQRLQRPSFIQKAKRSRQGHEDTGYSYVVIQRGTRPLPVNTTVGRIGAIGKKVLEEQRIANIPLRELQIHTDEAGKIHETIVPEELTSQITPELVTDVNSEDPELQAQLRKEAYQWPRLIFQPLKKSGHIILDGCTSEGKIMRLTIPKSQGKQPFYDARKSSWGDIFPHASKNKMVERLQPKPQRKGKNDEDADDYDFFGNDIGKRGDSFKQSQTRTYAAIADDLKEEKKKSKKDFAKTRGNKVWKDGI